MAKIAYNSSHVRPRPHALSCNLQIKKAFARETYIRTTVTVHSIATNATMRSETEARACTAMPGLVTGIHVEGCKR